ncbi:MAG: response regulator [Euryarchaeota archaeon]|nr:response regulator [Euryarchaeota archaeon]
MKALKILIVEDVPFDAELIERELHKAGIKFSSRMVEVEQDYLREIREFEPDLILADHSLPQFDGLSALEIAKKECPDVPFIFVSGKIGEEFAVEALKSGATDYVLKGNLSKIVHATKRALEEVEEQSKRKKAEEALRNGHRQLMEAQKIGHIGSWEWDIPANRLTCSVELYHILGVNPKEFGRTYDAILELIHPEDRPIVLKNVNRALQDHKPFSNEYRLQRPDGIVRILSSHGEVITDEAGQPLRIIVTEQDITERKIAEEKIKDSLREKEMLLAEIHHRVKNNLQVILSLLRLQSRYIKDNEALEIFKETQNRVRSIALVHEKLYQSKDLEKINFSDYVQIFTEDLFYFYGTDPNSVKLRINVEEISLNIETAILLGLIINELVTNSLKHAFSHGKNGEINIEIHSDEEDNFTLIVSDNGVGLPEYINTEKTDTFGLQLVKYLTKRIKGHIDLDRSQGTRFKITLKELSYKERTR